MARFHRLEVPSFDLTWLNLTNFDEVALVAGGGGSFKSGVKNQIQIARVHDADKVTFVESFITDEDTKRRLCCGLACGSILVCYLRLPCFVGSRILTSQDTTATGAYSYRRTSGLRLLTTRGGNE
jgi:hypothetical protein